MAVDEVLGGSVLMVSLIRPPGTFSRLREKERQRLPLAGEGELAGTVMVKLPRLCAR
ncbi:hypothetical protein XAB3213_3470004 [Xanthomonas citri pv. bilvae]|nr:hypothetical protein XAB3213_3470004 [Xanthomonas citri pv. bilvae]